MARAMGVLVAAALVTFAPAGADPVRPAGKGADETTLYDRDPRHLGNRVHAAFLVRRGPDGRTYGQDRLEPLLWTDSQHLLAGPSAEQALGVLEAFLRDKGETLVADPLKRAVLQRDLWMVASWLAGTPESGAKKKLEPALAAVIGRLALTPQQVAKLPDNYAAAVASKRFADRFDPDKPDRAYLPPDLFKPDGPWVCVGPATGPTAPLHLADTGTNRLANSVFLTFLKLPGGRDKTLAFLKALAAVTEPVVANPDADTKRAHPFVPNPALPGWPKGTEVALVRRALLIDSTRRVVASPLTESVQLRVVTADAPALSAKVLETIALRRDGGWHAFSEFQLRRADLFAGTAGGLREVSAERDFKTGFNAHPQDEFDDATADTFLQRSQPFASNRASCFTCHTHPGVASFNSVPGFALGGSLRPARGDGAAAKAGTPGPTTIAETEKRAVAWKEARPAWAALAKLLPK